MVDLVMTQGNSIAEDELLLLRTKAKKANQKDDGNAGMEPVSLKKLHVKTNNLTKVAFNCISARKLLSIIDL